MERVWWNRGGIMIEGINKGWGNSQGLSTVGSSYYLLDWRAVVVNGVLRLPDRMSRNTTQSFHPGVFSLYSPPVRLSLRQRVWEARRCRSQRSDSQEQGGVGISVDCEWGAQRITVILKRHGKLFSEWARACLFQTNNLYLQNTRMLMITKIL